MVIGAFIAVVSVHFILTWEHYVLVLKNSHKGTLLSSCHQPVQYKIGWSYEYGVYRYIICSNEPSL